MDELRSHLSEVEADDRTAAYWNAIRLAARGKITPALDGLLDILRENRRDAVSRKTVLALLEILGSDNPASRDYRKELASILF